MADGHTVHLGHLILPGLRDSESWPTRIVERSHRSPARVGHSASSRSPCLRRSGRQRSGGPPATAAPPLHPPKARPRPQDAVRPRPRPGPSMRAGGAALVRWGALSLHPPPFGTPSGGGSVCVAFRTPCSLLVLPTQPDRLRLGLSGGPTSGLYVSSLSELRRVAPPASQTTPPLAVGATLLSVA